MNDPLYEACQSFLQARQTVLWADWDLTRNRDKAARWLATQIQGVAEHYDNTAPPFFQAAKDSPLTAPYAGPYSNETKGGFNPHTVLEETLRQDPDYLTTPRQRPSATATHGQQPEVW